MIQDPNNGTETITSGLDRRTALKAALGGAAAAAVVAGPAVNGLGVLPAYAQTSSPPPSWNGSDSGTSATCVVDNVSTACCWGTFNANTSPRCNDATFTLDTGAGNPYLTVTRGGGVRTQGPNIGTATLAMNNMPSGGYTTCTTTLWVSCTGSPTPNPNPASPGLSDTFTGNTSASRTISCGTGAQTDVIGTLTVSMTCT